MAPQSHYGGWSNPYYEPKRPYRFIVPFPIFLPKKTGLVSEIFKTKTELRRPDVSKFGKDCYFPMFGISCTKPQITTEAFRIADPAGGFQPIRAGQPTSFDFQPVEIELLDTLDHDIEASLMAMVYAYGNVANPTEQKSPDPANQEAGTLIPIRNVDTLAPSINGQDPTEIFEIIELFDQSRYTMHGLDPALDENAAKRSPTARKIILYNPFITGITLGTLSHKDADFSTVKVQIAYDSCDYHFYAPRAVEPPGMRELSRTDYVLNKRLQETVRANLLTREQMDEFAAAGLHKEAREKGISMEKLLAEDQAEQRAAATALERAEFDRTKAIQDMSPADRANAQALVRAHGTLEAGGPDVAAMTPEERSRAVGDLNASNTALDAQEKAAALEERKAERQANRAARGTRDDLRSLAAITTDETCYANGIEVPCAPDDD